MIAYPLVLHDRLGIALAVEQRFTHHEGEFVDVIRFRVLVHEGRVQLRGLVVEREILFASVRIFLATVDPLLAQRCGGGVRVASRGVQRAFADAMLVVHRLAIFFVGGEPLGARCVARGEIRSGRIGSELVALGLERVDDLLFDLRVVRIKRPRIAERDLERVDGLIVGLQFDERMAKRDPHVAHVAFVFAALVEILRAFERLGRITLGFAVPRIGERHRDVLDGFVT